MATTCLVLSFWPVVIVAIWLGLRWRATKATGMRRAISARLGEVAGAEAAIRRVAKESGDAVNFALTWRGRSLTFSLTPVVLPPGSRDVAVQVDLRLRGVDQSIADSWLRKHVPPHVSATVAPSGLTLVDRISVDERGSLLRVCDDAADAAEGIERAFAAAVKAGRRPPEDLAGAGP